MKKENLSAGDLPSHLGCVLIDKDRRRVSEKKTKRNMDRTLGLEMVSDSLLLVINYSMLDDFNVLLFLF